MIFVIFVLEIELNNQLNINIHNFAILPLIPDFMISISLL